MMVANDIKYDTRVYKTALALADGGLEVTVLAFSPSGVRGETRFGPVRIVRVPVPFRLRKKRQERAQVRQVKRLFPPPPTRRDRRIDMLRYRLRRDEASEFGGAQLYARERLDWTRGMVRQQWAKVLQRAAPREDAWREAFRAWADEQTRFASWRRDLPEVDDFELAYAPFIDAEDWDILHAHDVHHIGTAARAVARRRRQGRPAQWIYDAHEYVAGLSLSPPRTARVRAAWVDLESEYIHRADAVITVTDPLAEQLQEQYSLAETPTVVMNSPLLSSDVPGVEGEDIRSACGLSPQTPLVVYSGGITSARGVQTVIDALPSLPGVHLAVVCVPHTRLPRSRALHERAVSLGIGDRVHLLDPVPPAQVSSFLRTADVGVAPFLHFGSHEFALPNKLFEYLCAGLPLVVSDCHAVAKFVRETRVGAVFTAEDAAMCAEAIRDVLDRRTALRQRIVNDDQLLQPYSWERQAANLRALYRRMLGNDGVVTEPVSETPMHAYHEGPAWREDRPSVVAIGPTNTAGQAWAWAKSMERALPGLKTKVISVERSDGRVFPADLTVASPTYRKDKAWGEALQREALAEWTHVLLETGLPLFGRTHGFQFDGDAKVLISRGVRVGLLLHGPEIRDPSRHAQLTPWSPFRDADEELTGQLERAVRRLATKIQSFVDQGLGPVFVSSPDLLVEVPGSIWLPVVVDLQSWLPGPPVLTRGRPVVAHLPNRTLLTGSTPVERTLTRLHEEGVVEYRRVENMPTEAMTAVMTEADIVLDELALGTYSALACEAMAAERIVLGHVLPEVRQAAAAASGVELPVIETTQVTLARMINDLLSDREGAAEVAWAGRHFVHSLHDGRYSAEVLGTHMHVRGAERPAVAEKAVVPVEIIATHCVEERSTTGVAAILQKLAAASHDKAAIDTVLPATVDVDLSPDGAIEYLPSKVVNGEWDPDVSGDDTAGRQLVGG